MAEIPIGVGNDFWPIDNIELEFHRDVTYFMCGGNEGRKG
jgi:hypothetical protein